MRERRGAIQNQISPGTEGERTAIGFTVKTKFVLLFFKISKFLREI